MITRTSSLVRSLFLLVPAAVALAGCLQPLAGVEVAEVDDNQPAAVVLTVAVGPSSGAGIVTSDPAGITCTPGCTAGFNAGSTVKLTAQAFENWTFDHWSDGCAGTSPTTTVVMDESKVCEAIFVAVQPPVPIAAADAGTSTSATKDDGGASTEIGIGVCCAAAGTDLAAAACEGTNEKCCLPVTLLECTSAHGTWMSVSACTAAPPTCQPAT